MRVSIEPVVPHPRATVRILLLWTHGIYFVKYLVNERYIVRIIPPPLSSHFPRLHSTIPYPLPQSRFGRLILYISLVRIRTNIRSVGATHLPSGYYR